VGRIEFDGQAHGQSDGSSEAPVRRGSSRRTVEGAPPAGVGMTLSSLNPFRRGSSRRENGSTRSFMDGAEITVLAPGDGAIVGAGAAVGAGMNADTVLIGSLLHEQNSMRNALRMAVQAHGTPSGNPVTLFGGAPLLSSGGANVSARGSLKHAGASHRGAFAQRNSASANQAPLSGGVRLSASVVAPAEGGPSARTLQFQVSASTLMAATSRRGSLHTSTWTPGDGGTGRASASLNQPGFSNRVLNALTGNRMSEKAAARPLSSNATASAAAAAAAQSSGSGGDDRVIIMQNPAMGVGRSASQPRIGSIGAGGAMGAVAGAGDGAASGTGLQLFGSSRTLATAFHQQQHAMSDGSAASNGRLSSSSTGLASQSGGASSTLSPLHTVRMTQTVFGFARDSVMSLPSQSGQSQFIQRSPLLQLSQLRASVTGAQSAQLLQHTSRVKLLKRPASLVLQRQQSAQQLAGTASAADPGTEQPSLSQLAKKGRSQSARFDAAPTPLKSPAHGKLGADVIGRDLGSLWDVGSSAAGPPNMDLSPVFPEPLGFSLKPVLEDDRFSEFDDGESIRASTRVGSLIVPQDVFSGLSAFGKTPSALDSSPLVVNPHSRSGSIKDYAIPFTPKKQQPVDKLVASPMSAFTPTQGPDSGLDVVTKLYTPGKPDKICIPRSSLPVTPSAKRAIESDSTWVASSLRTGAMRAAGLAMMNSADDELIDNEEEGIEPDPDEEWRVYEAHKLAVMLAGDDEGFVPVTAPSAGTVADVSSMPVIVGALHALPSKRVAEKARRGVDSMHAARMFASGTDDPFGLGASGGDARFSTRHRYSRVLPHSLSQGSPATTDDLSSVPAHIRSMRLSVANAQMTQAASAALSRCIDSPEPSPHSALYTRSSRLSMRKGSGIDLSTLPRSFSSPNAESADPSLRGGNLGSPMLPRSQQGSSIRRSLVLDPHVGHSHSMNEIAVVTPMQKNFRLVGIIARPWTEKKI
jgi:hypothetical protein